MSYFLTVNCGKDEDDKAVMIIRLYDKELPLWDHFLRNNMEFAKPRYLYKNVPC